MMDYCGKIIFTTLFLIVGINTLKIKELKVPNIIEFGKTNELILDCDYDIDNNAEGLVVKWFYDETQQVYQWIQHNKPQDSGRLKGKIDLNYKASNDTNKMYRALHINHVDPKLTGNYTCVVSTFSDEVRATKRMVIYNTELDFDLTYDVVDGNTLRIFCSAHNLYPKPDIEIHGERLDETAVKRNITLEENNDRYQVSASVDVEVDETPEKFLCELTIPDANYTKKLEFSYSGQETTEITSSSSEMNLQIADDDSRMPGGGNWIRTSYYTLLGFVSIIILLDFN